MNVSELIEELEEIERSNPTAKIHIGMLHDHVELERVSFDGENVVVL